MSSKTCFAKSSCIVLASALFCTSLPALATSSTAGTNLAVQQQDQKLKGQVIDATTGEPVIGVNVLVKGTTNGTITDIDGKYELNAPAGAILQISFIGYKTVEIAATTSEQTIKLHEDTETLDEVVVVGYGVQKKESLTGAMSTLKENRLKDVTTPTVENMLNGKVSGVYVAPGSGQPGSNGAVQIRGRATLSGSTSPLWVIDGVIVGEDPGVLNPSDIENMTILKDAASTAIYGSQGANGVIIVTTKMGKSEKMKINASVKLGVSTMTNGKMEVMNGAELYDYYASFPNQEDIKFSRWNPELRNANFDWGGLLSSLKLYPFQQLRIPDNDLNNFVTPGWAMVFGSTFKNLPKNAYSYGVVTVIGSPKSYDHLVQLYIPDDNSGFYFRGAYSGISGTSQITSNWNKMSFTAA